MKNAEAILDKIIKLKKTSISRRDLFRAVHSNSFPNAKSLDLPLEILENYGYVLQAYPDDYSGRGRPPGKIVYVNPKTYGQNKWQK